MTDKEAIDSLARTVGTLLEIVQRMNERVLDLESEVVVLKVLVGTH